MVADGGGYYNAPTSEVTGSHHRCYELGAGRAHRADAATEHERGKAMHELTWLVARDATRTIG